MVLCKLHLDTQIKSVSNELLEGETKCSNYEVNYLTMFWCQMGLHLDENHVHVEQCKAPTKREKSKDTITSVIDYSKVKEKT